MSETRRWRRESALRNLNALWNQGSRIGFRQSARSFLGALFGGDTEHSHGALFRGDDEHSTIAEAASQSGEQHSRLGEEDVVAEEEIQGIPVHLGEDEDCYQSTTLSESDMYL